MSSAELTHAGVVQPRAGWHTRKPSTAPIASGRIAARCDLVRRPPIRAEGRAPHESLTGGKNKDLPLTQHYWGLLIAPSIAHQQAVQRASGMTAVQYLTINDTTRNGMPARLH
jgi:hypothetical protein